MAPSLSNKQAVFALYPLLFSKYIANGEVSNVSNLDAAFDDSRVKTIHVCSENQGERWDRIRWACGTNDGSSNTIGLVFLVIYTEENAQWAIFDFQNMDTQNVSFSTPKGPRNGEFLIDGGICLKNGDRIGIAATNWDNGMHVVAEGGRFINDQDG